MPGARTVTVDGKYYSYVLKPSKKHQLPNRAVRLVVLFRPKQYITMTFKATSPSTPGTIAAKEQAGFRPGLISDVVRALEFHGGKLPDKFEVGQWRLEPSAESAQAADD